jgi:subtilisin-like proprotein convertase family protein
MVWEAFMPKQRRQRGRSSSVRTRGRDKVTSLHPEALEGRAMLAAVALPSGTSYTETFDGIGTALPTGWTVFTGATATSRGTAATLTTTATAWNVTTAGFKNYASADGGTSADATATQSGRTDRALGVRQTGSVGDPGAAFELELANTAGKTNFSLSLKHQMLDVQTRSTTWTVQYSTSGTSWTNLGTYADPGTWGSTAGSYSFGSAIDNVGGPVYVRIAALAGSTGSTNRDTYGIDDVSLTWTNSSSTAPTISGAATAAAFTTTYGTASAAQSFAVSGTNLTASLVATAPTGFEVSSDGTTYGTTATFSQSGGLASGTLRVRLAAAAAATGSYDAQNIVLSSTGATNANITTAATGNAVAAKGLTITGLLAQDKTFDGTTTATVTGTPAYAGLVNGETFTVSGSVSWAFPDATVGSGKTLVRTGSFATPSTNYTLTQPTLTASILSVTPSPAITVSPATLAGPLTTTTGTASAPQTFTVSGATLSGDLTVTAPTGLEVSATAGSGYADTLTLAASGGAVASTTVFVRLKSSAPVGTYDGLPITVGGGGATTRTVLTAASGNVVTSQSTVTLLAEDFATLTAGGNTASSGTGSPSGTEVTTNLTANFPTSSKAYSAGGAVKLGSSSAAGSITSKTLDLSGNGGAFTVTFDVKGWTTVEGNIVVTVSGQTPQTVSYSATISSAFETKTLSFTGGQAASTITFATSAKRAFLDNITVVGGSGSTVVVAPSAPTITGVTPASGQLSVAFSPPSSNGGASITNYQYSLDGGTNWVIPSPAVTASPLVITGLVNGQSYAVRLRAVNSAGPGTASATVTAKPGAIDYLRIVSYNITAADIAGVRTGFETLVQAMGAEAYSGHVDQVDLIAMQEVQSQATTSANLVTRLNAIYGSGAYARGTLDGDTTGSGTQGVVYNTAALQLLEERAIGTASTTGAPRQTLRYKFQPVGGDATSVFYVYNSHLKAADDSESASRRAADVQVIRADADALGVGTSIIYVGDFNLQTSNELAYERFLAAGNGQAFDPINRPGNWSNNSNFRDIFTQAPSANPPAGFAAGGLDDRYDFQLVSGAVMTGSGLAYKTGSYRTFGVDGSVAVGGSVNASSSTALPGLANRTQVLDLLTAVADHLPVVVDYSFLAVGQPVSPTIAVSPGMLAAALTTTVGTASAAQTFTVSGTALTGSLTVTAPTGLEVSLTAGSGYAATLTLAPSAGALASTTVYVRLAATAAAGNYNDAAITVSGGGATTQTVLTTASGNVVSQQSSTTLFAENFAAITTGDNTTTGGSSSAWTGSADWSNVTGAYQAGGAVRLGAGSAAGSITTRALDLTGNGGVFTVSFDVKGWTTVAGPVTVTVTGLTPQTVTYSATMSSAFETKTLQFTGGQANATITFSVASGQRAFLDNIVVSGGTPQPVVTAITGFVWDDADGDGTWDTPAEAGIAGRTVYLDIDRSGSLDAGEPSVVTATDGGYSFTGLGAGTYIVAQIVPQGWEQTFPSISVAAAQVRSAGGVQVATFTDAAYMPDDRQQQKRFVPNDPLFAQQWHLQNTGQKSGTVGEDADVVTAWDVAKGAGVVIGVVDDGLQYTHPDLAPGYRADLSYDFNGNDADPTPGTGDDHGTAAAGVAAARGNNGVGVSGTAPNASLAGIRLISATTTDQLEANGLTYKPQDIAIYSNSWGPNDDGMTLEAPGPLTRAALANAVQTGRGGKGSIYVWAAGNGLDANDNSNYDGYANSRFTIAVTAVDNRGKQSWYAEPGANILVAAPSSGDSSGTDVGIVTVDRTGNLGYNTSTTTGNLSDRDYTNDFGGTSSATPLVSGVVALMLEANPNLGWRDVQHILANTARKNDAADAGWSQNGVGKWVNHKYGFGVVDAAAAVNLAKTWTNVGPEVSASSGTINVGQPIPDNNATGITSSFTLGADIRMESVEVVFSATHASRGHLQVMLTAPSGTKSVLAEKHADTGDNYSGWVFSTVRDWGESSKGTWTLNVSDLTTGTTGTFGSWAINVYGTALPAPPGTLTVTVSAGQTVADANFGTRSLAPATPTLGTTGTLSGVSTTYGTASGTSSITVTGSDLTAAVTATAPTGFEVSSDGTTFSTTATFSPTSGAVSGTLYVRLAATTNAGTWSGDVSFASTGATNVTAAMPSSTVSAKALTITGLSAAGKTYDGTTAASLSGTAALFGVIGSDDVGLTGSGVGAFNSKDVNAANAVSVSGFALLGSQATNYTLTQPSLSASITAKALTVRADNKTKVVNAANPALTATLMGFVNGETAATAVTGAASLSTTAVQGSAVGSYPITVGAGTLAANGGNYTFSTLVNGTLAVTNAPVKVTGVYVKGSAWNATYLGLSTFTTVGASKLGWQLRDGANQVANAATVPWNNVNTISVQFDQAIATPAAAAVQLVAKQLTGYTGSTPVQRDVTLTPSSVSLLESGRVAQFVLPEALVTGKYVLSIASTGITDASVSTVLDGDWTTSTSTFASGSGDGTAGGMFNFAFNVLVGDLDASGTGNSQDLSSLKTAITRALGTTTGVVTYRYDLDGSNALNAQDVNSLKQSLIRTLGVALAPMASPTAPTVSAATIGLPTTSNVTASGARLGATVTSNGGEPVLERGVVLLAGETGTPDVTDPAAITLLSVGGSGLFTVDVTGLAASTSYRFRAFVKTSLGIVYSDVATFTTAAAG